MENIQNGYMTKSLEKKICKHSIITFVKTKSVEKT